MEEDKNTDCLGSKAGKGRDVKLKLSLKFNKCVKESVSFAKEVVRGFYKVWENGKEAAENDGRGFSGTGKLVEGNEKT